MKDINQTTYSKPEIVSAYMSNYSLQKAEQYILNKYLHANQRLLDVGCGGGRTTINFHEAGLNVTGIDLSSEMINAVSKRFPYLEFFAIDILNFNSDEKYDVIFFSFNGIDYINEMKSLEVCISNIASHLKNDGLFIYSSHNIKAMPFNSIKSMKLKRLLNIKHFNKDYSVIFEDTLGGLITNYTSCRFNVDLLYRHGFSLLESIGNIELKLKKKIKISFNGKENYIDPWVYYVFKKNQIKSNT